MGGFWYGGDWYGGRKAADGALWVIVADVTGHGYFAYLLASALPHVWEACWKTAPADVRPADLLHAMHDMLEACLPEGVYAECTLVRLDPNGEAVAVPAGGTRLFVRRRGAAPDLFKLRGAWLGLFPPSAADQKSWTLAEGDELLLGSDGAFDHLEEADGAGRLGRCHRQPAGGRATAAARGVAAWTAEGRHHAGAAAPASYLPYLSPQRCG